MATVFAAVKGTGGFLQLESEPGKGTTFRVYLPQAAGVADIVDVRPVLSTLQRGTGTVLVVDDDAMVLPVYRDILEYWGYSVVAVDSSDAARGELLKPPDRIAVAVIDVGVEDGSGIRLAEDLVRERPSLAVLLVGDRHDQSVPESVARNVCARLSKPFRPESLAAAVADAVGIITNR